MRRARASVSRMLGLGLVLCAAVAQAGAPAARSATPEEFARELQALRGKVVMVNVWATWCVPCLKEVPDLLEVEREFAGRGFVLLGLSIDEPGDVARVESFRQKWFADFHTLVRDAPDMDTAVSVIDAAWNEIVPTTYLLGRDGRVLVRIQGKKSRDEFRQAAQAALAAR